MRKPIFVNSVTHTTLGLTKFRANKPVFLLTREEISLGSFHRVAPTKRVLNTQSLNQSLKKPPIFKLIIHEPIIILRVDLLARNILFLVEARSLKYR